jgi:protein involved in polysaccharide export with SLBB domain
LPPVIGGQGPQPLSAGETPPPAPQSKEGNQPGVKEGANAAEAANAPKAGETAGMSTLEKAMSADGEAEMAKTQPFTVGAIRQFGYNFFKDSGAFSPVADAPVSPDYVVGPGDTLVITAWGSVEGSWSQEVNRSGEITLPRIGSINVWGIPFAKVPDVIRANLSKIYRDVQLNVTMGKLRLMKVYLVGEVASPGDYNISSLSTVINALAAAGGPTKNGSLRSIQVLRGGKVVEIVDLYDFFLKGDKSRDIRLQPGDTVRVPIIGRVAGIGGNVRRPAIFELKNERNLKELIELGGGFNPSSYLNRIQISRVEAHNKKLAADFNLDPTLSDRDLGEMTKKIPIQDQDLVKVFPIDVTLRDSVRLDGYVLRPGVYALKPGMRVKDLIGKDNTLPESYPDTLEITRLIPPDFHPEKMYVSLDRAMQGNEQDNLLLKEFDSVKLFSRWEMQEMPTVRISGEIQKPGAYRLYANMSLRDLIYAAGNVKTTAYLKSAEITRSIISKEGVKSHIINVDLDEALKANPSENILLEKMDEVVVRRLPDWKEETDRYVTLRGEFRFPGVYPLMPGEKLSDLIQRAGGYSDRAYLKGAKFTRLSTRELQQKRMDEALMRAEQDLAQKQQDLASTAASKEELESTQAAISGMKASIEKLKLFKAEGRISIQLAPLAEMKMGPHDLALQGGDTIEIPRSTDAVVVYGEVYNPTTLIQLPEKRLGYYLKKSGGCTQNADEDEMYVIKADGTVVSRREHSGFFDSGFLSLRLDAGDTLIVPQRLEKIAWMRELKDIATILGQIALTAGVVIAAM